MARETKRFWIEIDVELDKKLSEIAKAEGRSKNAQVSQIIKESLKDK